MQLLSLTLHNFKNITEATLEFSPKINGLLGNNGMGKSNLLDAIHFMSFCKSFTGVPDAMVVRRGAEFAMARGVYLRSGVREELTLGLVPGRRKSLKRGGKEYGRLSEHIGAFPLVMAAPQDVNLVRGSGEERRRWMDMVISQGSHTYLEALIRYGLTLEQRNRLLREQATADRALLEAIELQMAAAAAVIYAARRERTARLAATARRFYNAIAGDTAEEIGMTYTIDAADEAQADADGIPDLMDMLERARRRDTLLRHTTVGPHRDDLEMTLCGMPMRRTASQGQCKTFTTALRLAQYEELRASSGMRPLLLLDDIFDKLDAGRVERIISLVTSDDFGQIFISDTNRTHLDEIMGRSAGADYRLWSVSDGSFTPALHPSAK